MCKHVHRLSFVVVLIFTSGCLQDYDSGDANTTGEPSIHQPANQLPDQIPEPSASDDNAGIGLRKQGEPADNAGPPAEPEHGDLPDRNGTQPESTPGISTSNRKIDSGDDSPSPPDSPDAEHPALTALEEEIRSVAPNVSTGRHEDSGTEAIPSKADSDEPSLAATVPDKSRSDSPQPPGNSVPTEESQATVAIQRIDADPPRPAAGTANSDAENPDQEAPLQNQPTAAANDLKDPINTVPDSLANPPFSKVTPTLKDSIDRLLRPAQSIVESAEIPEVETQTALDDSQADYPVPRPSANEADKDANASRELVDDSSDPQEPTQVIPTILERQYTLDSNPSAVAVQIARTGKLSRPVEFKLDVDRRMLTVRATARDHQAIVEILNQIRKSRPMPDAGDETAGETATLSATSKQRQRYQGPRLGLVRDKSKNGAVVGEVRPHSPAATAGFQPGDVIYRINNEVIQDFGQLAAALATHHPGDTVQIIILRNGTAQLIRVKLGEPERPRDQLQGQR